jgi:hypothetical protein
LRDIKPEDTVVLIDASRSMMRKDFKPDRITVALHTVKNFIHTKFLIDPKDRIAILSFGDDIRKLSSFSYEEEKLIHSLDKLKISGNSQFTDGIAFSLQILVNEMRKLGGKNNRILIITDGNPENSQKMQKLVEIAKGLHIFIDVCQYGIAETISESFFKKACNDTRGEYGFFNNSKAILNSGKAFASKKESATTTDYFAPNKIEKIAPLISEIALPLRRPSVLDIRLMMAADGKGQEKCQICHSAKSPVTNSDFYSEGRYCPSCDRPMHISCAAMWAQKTEYKDNVFRCPFCYFLLELPSSASKIIQDRQESEPKIKLLSQDNKNDTTMILIEKELISKINASCSYCRSIFLGDYNVFQCDNCGAYYHEPCLEKMNQEIRACRNCGSKIRYGR